MINEINRMLKGMGSKFRTNDGKVLVRYNGDLVFLKKSYETVNECYNYVLRIYNDYKMIGVD